MRRALRPGRARRLLQARRRREAPRQSAGDGGVPRGTRHLVPARGASGNGGDARRRRAGVTPEVQRLARTRPVLAQPVLLPAPGDAAAAAGVVALLLGCLGSTRVRAHVGHLELILQLLERRSSSRLSWIATSAFCETQGGERRGKGGGDEEEESEGGKKGAERGDAAGPGRPRNAGGYDTRKSTTKEGRGKRTTKPRPPDEDFAVARIRGLSDYYRLSPSPPCSPRGLTDSVSQTARVAERWPTSRPPPRRAGLALSAEGPGSRTWLTSSVRSPRRRRTTREGREAEAEARRGSRRPAASPSVTSGSAFFRLARRRRVLKRRDAAPTRDEAAGNALAAAGAGPDDVIPPPRSGADVEAERRRRRKSMGERYLRRRLAGVGRAREACTG